MESLDKENSFDPLSIYATLSNSFDSLSIYATYNGFYEYTSVEGAKRVCSIKKLDALEVNKDILKSVWMDRIIGFH